MPVQVIVKHGDRVWDSIKGDDDTAMFKVTEYMREDHDPDVARIGDLLQRKLIFGKGAAEGARVFTEHGFVVTIKELNQGE